MTTTANLYSYFPGLQVTDLEVAQAELLAQQILEAKFPDTDFREGTAIRDLVVRPSATILAIVNKAITFYFSQNTIQGADNATSQDFIDKILSNWFLARKQGSQSVINARLFFAKQKSVSLVQSVYFSTDGTLKFSPQTNVSIPATTMVFDASSNEYYLDLDLVAESAGVAYNISSGSLLYFSNFDPYFLHAEINYLRDVAADVEDNTTFISRSKYDISTRNLINNPSILSNVLENFNMISNALPKGYGDKEMIRDKNMVVIPGVDYQVWAHLGGKVDVYCNVPRSNSSVQVLLDSLGTALLTGAIYKFSRSATSAGPADDTVAVDAPFSWHNYNSTLRNITDIVTVSSVSTLTVVNHGMDAGRRFTMLYGSASAQVAVRIIDTPTADSITCVLPTVSGLNTGFLRYVTPAADVGHGDSGAILVDMGTTNANKTASFNISYFYNIDGIQNYLEDPVTRVLCADLRARGFNIYLLSLNVVGYNGPVPNGTTILSAANKYVSSLVPGQTFVMSDLQSYIFNAGITTIQTPIATTYSLYTNDLHPAITGTITDTLNPDDATAIFLIDQVTTSTLNA